MKPCPFCAEPIQDEAIKCRYCGEFLEEKPQKKQKQWYFSTPAVVTAILTLGPLALPLVWRHPRYSRAVKWVLTILLTALTVYSLLWARRAYLELREQLRLLGF